MICPTVVLSRVTFSRSIVLTLFRHDMMMTSSRPIHTRVLSLPIHSQHRQIGPGMVQQIQSVCSDCGGRGETIPEADRCKECRGKKLVPETKVIEVPIDKGMRGGQQVRMGGEGNHEPGVPPGDLIVELAEKEDPNFERRGQDLVHKHKINLLEALTGYKFALQHLDGRTLIIEGKHGEIIQPGDVRVIPDEGMPQYKNPFVKGRLFISRRNSTTTPRRRSPRCCHPRRRSRARCHRTPRSESPRSSTSQSMANRPVARDPRRTRRITSTAAVVAVPDVYTNKRVRSLFSLFTNEALERLLIGIVRHVAAVVVWCPPRSGLPVHRSISVLF